jgi:transposase
MARPPKINDEIVDTICAAIGRGITFRRACLIAGIGYRTFYRWLEQAEEDDADPIYVEFKRRVEKAEADALALAEVVFYQGALADPKIAERLLARRDPDQYGERTVNHRVSGGVNVNHAIEAEAKVQRLIDGLEPELLDALVQNLLRGAEPSLPRLTEIGGTEEPASLHQVHLPWLPSGEACEGDSGDAGEGDEW